MKKLFLGIVVLGLLLSTNAFSKVGKGDLNINNQTLNFLIEYLRNEFSSSFVVSKNGNRGYYGLCHSGRCSGGQGATSTLLKKCKKETGDNCFIFAQTKKKKKVIRWNNVDYAFPEGDFNYVGSYNPDSKGEGINKSITDDQIKSVLNQFGFIYFNKVVAKIDINIQKKETKIKENYYCIWYHEYSADYLFTHNKISPATCGDEYDHTNILFIVKELEHKKLYNSLKWRYKNETNGRDTVVAEVPKKLMLKIEKQIPKLKKIDNKVVVNNEEIQKKETTKKIEKKTTTKSISPELKLIEDMYKSGALTKEEYDAAKKRATQ